MPNVKRLAMIATYVLLGTAACAEESVSTDIEERLANIERMLAANSQVQPAAYPQMVAQADVPYTAIPYEAVPPDAGSYQAIPVPQTPEQPISEELACQSKVLCTGRPRYDHWMFDVELIPTLLHVTRGEFGSWDSDHAPAGRFTLGYEKADGIGVRGRFWAFDQEATTYDRDVDASAYLFQFDLYKRLIVGDTEILLGAGSTAGHLEFELVPERTESDFSGGGYSLFAEGYQPLLRGEKSELGFVARGRMSMMIGNWDDTTGSVIPPTDRDTMTVFEIAVGAEYRRYFGEFEDKYWHLGLFVEGQRWESDWMGAFLGSSATFTGANVNFGVAW
jgi:hypothetical protein